MRVSHSASILAIAIASATVAVQGQAEGDKGNVTAISEWNYDTLYEEGGMTADSLMDTEVFGSDNEKTGSVENILLNDKNEIVAIIAQVGGLWDIGDTHVLVPWEEVEVNEDGVIQAIIVKPASDETGEGLRAYPFYGYPEGWRPGDTHYVLPFAGEDIEKMPVFEYEKYKSLMLGRTLRDYQRSGMINTNALGVLVEPDKYLF